MDQIKKKFREWGERVSISHIIIGLLFLPFIFASLFMITVLLGIWGPVPGKGELSSIENYEASQLYSADGKLLTTYYLQNRTEVPLDEISPAMIEALVAVEDARFYEHEGIDLRALTRVFVKSILLSQDAGGGSTITQQLAKNLYPREGSGMVHLVADKLREMMIAQRLERAYDKDKILELYLNSVSFGEDVFGVEMASQRFFDKEASELNVEEAATLVGMLKATSWYNPRNYPERTKQRRNVVIHQMQTYRGLDKALADSLSQLPMEIDYNRLSTNEGPAPYFSEQIRQQVFGLLKSETALDGQEYNLYTDGLVIRTTVDSRVQEAAENAVSAQMKELQSILDRQIEYNPIFSDRGDSTLQYVWQQSDHFTRLTNKGFSESEIDSVLHQPVKMELFTWDGYQQMEASPYDSLRHYLSFLNSGFLAMNPQNGHVLAWVGGINHKHFQYDHVKSRRQVGSAFKPIVYAAALEAGMRPCDYRRNILTTYEDYEDWTPRNHADEYGGRYSLQAALAQSYNTIAVNLLMDTGISEVQETAQKMGIHSYIPPEPSIALGTAEVSLLEPITAYSTFLNNGTPPEPQMITTIHNARGELIYDFTGSQVKTVSESTEPEENASLSPRTAATMVKMLEKVVNEGTGYPLRSRFGIRHALAGKTGTTQDYTDGWFIGMSPDMVFGSWVGGWNYRVRFRGNMGYASQTALPIVGRFLQNLQNYSEYEQANQFYPEQTDLSYRMSCPDFRPDKFSDRLRDFFKGRDDDEARVEDGDDEKKGLFGRIKSIFSRDKNDDENEGEDGENQDN